MNVGCTVLHYIRVMSFCSETVVIYHYGGKISGSWVEHVGRIFRTSTYTTVAWFLRIYSRAGHTAPVPIAMTLVVTRSYRAAINLEAVELS